MAAFRHTPFVCRGKSEVALEYMPFFLFSRMFLLLENERNEISFSVMKFNETVVVDS